MQLVLIVLLFLLVAGIIYCGLVKIVIFSVLIGGVAFLAICLVLAAFGWTPAEKTAKKEVQALRKRLAEKEAPTEKMLAEKEAEARLRKMPAEKAPAEKEVEELRKRLAEKEAEALRKTPVDEELEQLRRMAGLK
jgi:cell division protein FtsN